MLDFMPTPESSWIDGTTYAPTGDRKGTLVIWTKTSGYAYFEVPCVFRALIHSGTGKVYNRVFKKLGQAARIPNMYRPT